MRPPGFLTPNSDMVTVLHDSVVSAEAEAILCNVYLFIRDRQHDEQDLLRTTKCEEAVSMFLQSLRETRVSEQFSLDHWIRDILAVADALEDAQLYSPLEQRYIKTERETEFD